MLLLAPAATCWRLPAWPPSALPRPPGIQPWHVLCLNSIFGCFLMPLLFLPTDRREWAEEQGLPDFASPQYDDALDAVCSRLSVHTGFKHR